MAKSSRAIRVVARYAATNALATSIPRTGRSALLRCEITHEGTGRTLTTPNKFELKIDPVESPNLRFVVEGTPDLRPTEIGVAISGRKICPNFYLEFVG